MAKNFPFFSIIFQISAIKLYKISMIHVTVSMNFGSVPGKKRAAISSSRTWNSYYIFFYISYLSLSLPRTFPIR